jgi:hypothetical protein
MEGAMSGTRHRQSATNPRDLDELPRIVREAQRIVVVETWRAAGEQAAARLVATTGVRTTRLFPESKVILVVAVNGQVVGRVRRQGRRWVAVAAGPLYSPSRLRTRRRAIAYVARRAASAWSGRPSTR